MIDKPPRQENNEPEDEGLPPMPSRSDAARNAEGTPTEEEARKKAEAIKLQLSNTNNSSQQEKNKPEVESEHQSGHGSEKKSNIFGLVAGGFFAGLAFAVVEGFKKAWGVKGGGGGGGGGGHKSSGGHGGGHH